MAEVLLMEGCPICGVEEKKPPSRHCVAVRMDESGRCRCVKYAPGPRSEDEPSFKELCERIKLEGGNIDMARKCVRWQEVYSPVLGKMVRRCADFEGGGLSGIGNLGALSDILTPDVVGTIKTGLIAAAGAVVGDKATEYAAEKFGVSGNTKLLLQAAIGILGGGLVYKFTANKELATAVALGPVFLAAYNAISPMLAGASSASTPTAGLGLITRSEYQPVPTRVLPASPLTSVPVFGRA